MRENMMGWAKLVQRRREAVRVALAFVRAREDLAPVPAMTRPISILPDRVVVRVCLAGRRRPTPRRWVAVFDDDRPPEELSLEQALGLGETRWR